MWRNLSGFRSFPFLGLFESTFMTSRRFLGLGFWGVLGVGSPFFSIIVLFKNQLFLQGVGWFFRKKDGKVPLEAWPFSAFACLRLSCPPPECGSRIEACSCCCCWCCRCPCCRLGVRWCTSWWPGTSEGPETGASELQSSGKACHAG